MRNGIALLTAGMLFGTCLTFPASAADAPGVSVVSGDADGDGFFDYQDVNRLRGWLLTEMTEPAAGSYGTVMIELEPPDMQASDLNADGSLDVRDLTLMKRLLMNGSAAHVPMDPPIRVLNPTLPSVGTDRIPVFAVSFPDCAFPAGEADSLQARCFGAQQPGNPSYPLESVSAYYLRASGGMLRLTGDVLPYTAAHEIGWYAETHAQALLEELLEAFDEALDFRDYDADENQIMDAVILALPDAALKIDDDGDGKPDWWPFSGTSVCGDAFDGVKPGEFCVLTYSERLAADFVSKAAHELGHAMGLPDYYRYTESAVGEHDGMLNPAGYELMDEGCGDLSAFSRLMLGWLAANQIQVYTGGTQNFTLSAMQHAPSCIMIPRDPDAGFLSEYFLIEYQTSEGNHARYGDGIRVLHVQAEVSEGKHGPEFTYSNYGLHYDKSDQKQRVLRLVNDYGAFYPYRDGTELVNYYDSRTEAFRWYDEAGDLTVGTGLKIGIGRLIPGPGYQPDPFSSRNPTDDPAYRCGSCYRITVSETE